MQQLSKSCKNFGNSDRIFISFLAVLWYALRDESGNRKAPDAFGVNRKNIRPHRGGKECSMGNKRDMIEPLESDELAKVTGGTSVETIGYDKMGKQHFEKNGDFEIVKQNDVGSNTVSTTYTPKDTPTIFLESL